MTREPKRVEWDGLWGKHINEFVDDDDAPHLVGDLRAVDEIEDAPVEVVHVAAGRGKFWRKMWGHVSPRVSRDISFFSLGVARCLSVREKTNGARDKAS